MKGISYDVYRNIKDALAKGFDVESIVNLTGVSKTTVVRIKSGTHHFDTAQTKAPEAPAVVPPQNTDISALVTRLDNLQATINAYGEYKKEDDAQFERQLAEAFASMDDKLGKIHTALCRLNAHIENVESTTKTIVDYINS
jgi:ABC-type ATPase with predicted acetyltransferase domain